MILFTPEEYQEIVWLAECDSGIKRKKTQEKNVSAYIRKCIFDKNDNPAAIKKELRDLSYQVRKIGVNINQVVTKINAGYAVWRECIAEIIAIECDDNCDIFPIRDKKKMLTQLRDEIDQRDGKLLVSEILTAVMTSAEVEASQTWDEAEKAIHSLKLFDTAPEMDLMRLVFNQLQDRLIEIDVDFISELGFLYLNILSLSLLRNFQMP